MKNLIIAFFVFLVWSFIGLLVYSIFWKDNGGDKKESINTEKIEQADKVVLANKNLAETLVDSTHIYEQPTKANAAIIPGLINIDAQGNSIFDIPGGISIFENTDNINFPSGGEAVISKITLFMLEHSNSEIHIYSVYAASENIDDPNYGMQRGNKIRKLLREAGIPSEKILIKPVIKEFSFNADREYLNGIWLQLEPLNLERVQNIKNELPSKRIIYPIFIASGISQNRALQTFANELKDINREYPQIKLEVIGHTDNIGNAVDNYNEGLKYAKQLRFYLISKANFPKDRISASSKGESQPISTNNSQAGRIANRRLEIIFTY